MTGLRFNLYADDLEKHEKNNMDEKISGERVNKMKNQH